MCKTSQKYERILMEFLNPEGGSQKTTLVVVVVVVVIGSLKIPKAFLIRSGARSFMLSI